jgi:UDP:flavonoid glycosyltransferase YjiC (YdhE family)
MRILMTTRGSAGHVLPLVPFGRACRRAGHDVLVAAQRQHQCNVERTGLPHASVGDPPAREWRPLVERLASMTVDEANALMIGEFFARVDTRAALPGQRALVAEWRPDLIVSESWEFASTIVAEEHSIPLARVGLGLAEVEELSIRLAAPAIDEARLAAGLPSDPAGDRLRDAPYLTMVPAPLDDPSAAAPSRVLRFAQDAPSDPQALPDWWPGRDGPLVYVTFGTVAAGEHLPYYPALYRAAIDALADLPARILLTIGDARDSDELGPLPANVHVERWVAHDAVARDAAAIVCHGGYGSMLGSLRYGVPLVVLPLFSIDQWANGAAVARTGAGLTLGDAERHTRRGLVLPAVATIADLNAAVRRVLEEPSFRSAARRIGAASEALPRADAAVGTLEHLAGRIAAPAS